MEKCCSNRRVRFLGSMPVLFLQDNSHSKHQASETAQKKKSLSDLMNVIWLAVSSLEVMKEVIKDWTTTLSKTLFIRVKTFQINCFQDMRASSTYFCASLQPPTSTSGMRHLSEGPTTAYSSQIPEKEEAYTRMWKNPGNGLYYSLIARCNLPSLAHLAPYAIPKDLPWTSVW